MKKTGKILSCVGGLYTVLSGGERYACYAKGQFRVAKVTPTAGDDVEFEEAEGSRLGERKGAHGREEYGRIETVLPRKNVLIRPPLANLDRLFVVAAVRDPAPSLLSVDKLTAIAKHNGIETDLVFSKTDLDPDAAPSLSDAYRKAGFFTVEVNFLDPDKARELLLPRLTPGSVSAFAGASGVGKSTLINTLFPSLGMETGSVSRKTQRGRHTTRQSLLFDVSADLGYSEPTFLADTPGFSLLDFQRFFFMEKEDLPFAFPEFAPYLGKCRYTKCTHTCEDGCRILEAVREGGIAPSRHESYRALYDELKDQRAWERK